MSRTIIEHFSSVHVKYVIYDLPVMSALQKYSLTSRGIFATSSIDEWLNKIDGPAVLLVTDLNDLNIALSRWEAIRKPSSTAAFASFWAISESPIDLRNAVLNVVAPIVDNIFITYQREFENKDNRNFFSLSMPDLLEDHHNAHCKLPFTWLNGRMEYGIQHYVDGDMFIVGAKRSASTQNNENKYALYVSNCSNVVGNEIHNFCTNEFTPEWATAEDEETQTCKQQITSLREKYCAQANNNFEPFRLKLWKRDISPELENAWTASTNIRSADDDDSLCFLQ